MPAYKCGEVSPVFIRGRNPTFRSQQQTLLQIFHVARKNVSLRSSTKIIQEYKAESLKNKKIVSQQTCLFLLRVLLFSQTNIYWAESRLSLPPSEFWWRIACGSTGSSSIRSQIHSS